MAQKKRRRAAWLAAAIAFGSSVFTQPALAENPASDCGSMAGYQPRAPWPTFKGCSTRLGQSRSFGPKGPNSSAVIAGSIGPLAGDVGSPVISAEGMVYFAGGNKLYAYSLHSSYNWSIDMGEAILGTPALGQDGTIHTVVNGSFPSFKSAQVVAINPSGTVKWRYNMTFGMPVVASPVIGPDRTIYAADTAGFVHAITPSGAQKWAPKNMLGPINSSPMLSKDGMHLYVGNDAMQFRALSTADGSEKWLSILSIGSTATGTIGADGTIYVGSNLGKLYAINPQDGSKKWELQLNSNVIASPSFTPSGLLIVATYGSIIPTPLLPATLYAINPVTRGVVWSVPIASRIVASPVVDAAGTIFLGDAADQARFRAIDSRNGQVLWSYPVSEPIWATAAITNGGQVIFGSNNDMLYGTVGTGGSGTSTNPDDRGIQKPSVGVIEQYCDGSTLSAGSKRPGVSYTKATFPGSALEYISSYKVDPNFAGDCRAWLCDDNEQPLSSAEVNRLTSDPNQRMPQGALESCSAVDAPAQCPPDRTKVRWTKPCTPGAVPSQCATGEACVYQCPKAANSTLPQDQCDGAREAAYCTALSTKNCTGLTGPDNPDPVRGVKECHELRECARDDDRITAAEAEPECTVTGSTSKSCDLNQPPQAPAVVASDVAKYAPMGLWTEPEANFCSFANAESAGKSHKSGAPSSSGGAKKQKKWGVNANASLTTDFKVNPMAAGLFKPYAQAHGKLYLAGAVMGKNVPVFDLYADAVVGAAKPANSDGSNNAAADPCQMWAAGGLKLFGYTVDHYQAGKKPATGDSSACGEFYKQIEYKVGAVKSGLFTAARVYNAMREQCNPDSTGKCRGTAVATKAMCEELGGNCTGQVFPRVQAEVANHYIKQYNNSLSAFADQTKKLQTESFAAFGDAMKAKGFSADATAISQTLPFVDYKQDFSVGAAAAYFPIGPITLSIEVRGYGNYGVKGGVDYGAKFFPLGSPRVWAGANMRPFANLRVDVFVGAGFEFGIGGASAGMGGNVLLVGISAPVFADIVLSGSQQNAPQRALPSDLGPLSTQPLMTSLPSVLTKKTVWNVSGRYGAGATVNLLSGSIDARLRIRFFWFSKTWKKKICTFDGFSKTYSWTGSTSPSAIDNEPASVNSVGFTPVSLDVLPRFPLIQIPEIPISWFGTQTLPSWKTSSQITNAAHKDHLIKIERINLDACKPPPPPPPII